MVAQRSVSRLTSTDDGPCCSTTHSQPLFTTSPRANPVPAGSVLLTGTGLVPPDDFTLEPGHVVEIHVPGIGTLTNPVVAAEELLTTKRSELHV